MSDFLHNLVKQMDTLRKIAAIPTSVLGCIGGLIAGEYALSLRAYFYCPPELREGSDCYAESWETWPDVFLAPFAGLSGLLCIALAAGMAPSHKPYWAKWALAVGAVLATCVFLVSGMLFSYLTALLSGGLTAMAVERLTHRSSKDAVTSAF